MCIASSSTTHTHTHRHVRGAGFDGGGGPHPRDPTPARDHPVRYSNTQSKASNQPTNQPTNQSSSSYNPGQPRARPEQVLPGLLGLEEDIACVRLARNRRDVEVVFHPADLEAGRGALRCVALRACVRACVGGWVGRVRVHAVLCCVGRGPSVPPPTYGTSHVSFSSTHQSHETSSRGGGRLRRWL